MEKQAGYVIGDNGRPIAAGVVCKCEEPGRFCPAHGRTAANQPPLNVRVLRHIAAFRSRPSVRILDTVYGPQAKALRTQVAAMILGRKVTGSDKAARYGNLRAALLSLVGAEGNCKAAEDGHFEELARKVLDVG